MPTLGKVMGIAPWNGSNFDIQSYNKAIKPYHLYFNLQTGAVTVPASTAAGPLRVDYRPIGSSNNRLDEGFRSPFLWDGIVFASADTANAAFTIRLTQDGSARRFMDYPQHILNIAGVAQTPAILRQALLIDSNSTIWAELQNTVGSTTTARVYLRGKLYCPWTNSLMVDQEGKKVILEEISKYRMARNYVQPFWASPNDANELSSVTVGANATSTFSYRVGDDACFEAFLLNSVSTGAYTIEISIPRKKQTLGSRMSNTIGAGSANFPFIFPTTFLVYPGYEIQFKITDLSGSSNTIYLSMHGRKIYAPPNDVREVLSTFGLRSNPNQSDQFPYPKVES